MSAPALPAVERRRRAALRPPEPPHEVELRPLAGAGEAGMIVAAAETDFLPAVFADLAAEDWRARLAARRSFRRGADGAPELSPPVHRRFQLVLFEAVCRQPGFPRLDPAKLVGMGMVLRREGPGGPLGWIGAPGAGMGWLAPAGGPDRDPDPQPPGAEARPRAVRELERMLAERRGPAGLAEQVAPLHPAPPEVCKARGKTILFGVLPLASSETTRGGAELDGLSPDEEAALSHHFARYFKEGAAVDLPRGGDLLDPAWAPLERPDAVGEDGRLYALAVFLRQLVVELGVLGEGDAQKALAARLDRLRVVVRTPPRRPPRAGETVAPRLGATISALTFVRWAAPVLLAGEPNAGAHRMPLVWPAIDAGTAAELMTLARACLRERFAAVAPDVPKFDDDRARYRARGFVRVACAAGCPPKLVWSPPSEPFRIRPWWDSDAPPVRISLPDVEQARDVRPGVAFDMPPKLAKLLQGNMRKLLDGADPGGPGLGLGWLCSFSIPIITICAFIVLNIFLTLLNFVFQWLLWIRVCLPIPKKGDG